MSDTALPTSALNACVQARASEPNECQSSERAPGDGDAAALGFDAEALLRLITGEHRTTLGWAAPGEPPSTTELVLTIEPVGEVRFLERETRSSGFGEVITSGNTGGMYLRCGDRLAVDAHLHVATSDGALNENVDAVVEAESGRYARTTFTLRADDIDGSLRPEVEPPSSGAPPPAAALTLALGITEVGTGLEGTIASHSLDPDAAGRMPCSQLGAFDLGSSCDLGAFPVGGDEELLGLSFPGILALLNATSPAELKDTGAALTLAFTAPADPVCISIDTPAALPSILEVPGHVQLASDDGRVGGALDVQLTAAALNGTLERVTARAETLVPDTTGLPELAPSYAILQPLSWTALEVGGFELEVEAAANASGGLLRALGGNLSCQGSRPCEEVCPAPGCNVTTAEKWAVRWGSLPVGDPMPVQD